MIRFFLTEHRRNPWVLPGVLLTGSAALGSAIGDIAAAIHVVLS
jgi:hypothetical protein